MKNKEREWRIMKIITLPFSFSLFHNDSNVQNIHNNSNVCNISDFLNNWMKRLIEETIEEGIQNESELMIIISLYFSFLSSIIELLNYWIIEYWKTELLKDWIDNI